MENLVIVCVDSYLGHDFSGRFYTYYSKELPSFTDITPFLLHLKQFYDINVYLLLVYLETTWQEISARKKTEKKY